MSKPVELDYKKLGLKCGIEIHQQLEGKKLFCDSPTLIRDDKPDYIIKRKLRAVIGESGKLDEAAKKEMAKNKTYVYEGYSDTIGLVELDEEPPHTMNKDALDTTLQLSMLLNAQIVDEVQVMRKNVVDGSNTSGFQRTALVAQDGTVFTSENKPITVPTIIVEEDACKKVKEEDGGKTLRYNLSRLGIPLIEIGTGPDIRTPQEAKDVAEKLGMLLRSTGRVKRGLGTIRQDVNVSIKEGRRVEIKGAQDLNGIPTLIDNEIIRQINLVQLTKDLKNSTLEQSQDVTKIFKDTNCELIKKSLKKNAGVFGAKLTHANGLVGKELQPNKRLGTDFSDFAKVHAGLGGIMHSDENFDKYSITDEEITNIKSQLDIKKDDAFLLIVAPQAQAEKGFIAIAERLDLLKTGVPSEVRRANPDYTTTYMRPMPGEARMYPETDCLPLKVDTSHITKPELIEDKIQRFIDEYELGVDLATAMAKGHHADTFDKLAAQFPSIKSATIAETIESVPKTLKRKDNIQINPTEDDYVVLFTKLDQNKIAVSSISDILKKAHGKSVADVIANFELMSNKELKAIIDKVKSENEGAPMGALMGKIMAQTKGRADGKKVQELLRG